MKKLNKKGFTLIELLAVIVILGLLMAVAIPSVTKYIEKSRRDTLTDSIQSFISAATTAVNNREYGTMSNPQYLWYIPVSDDETKSCVALERGGNNPFGSWSFNGITDKNDPAKGSTVGAYVVVHYNATTYSFDYYFTYVDDAQYGMALTHSNDIDESDIVVPFTMNLAAIKGQKITYNQDVNGDGDTDDENETGLTATPKVLNLDKCNVSSLES